MRHTVAFVAVLTLAAVPAVAGIIDTPVPQGFKLVYSVPAISGTMVPPNGRPVFTCTNTHKSEITVGVEVFTSLGGPPAGNPEAARLTVPVGATVSWGMGAPFSFAINKELGVAFGNGKGSARIVATSSNVMCTAYLVDYDDGMPVLNLTIVGKTKQKAAN